MSATKERNTESSGLVNSDDDSTTTLSSPSFKAPKSGSGAKKGKGGKDSKSKKKGKTDGKGNKDECPFHALHDVYKLVKFLWDNNPCT